MDDYVERCFICDLEMQSQKFDIFEVKTKSTETLLSEMLDVVTGQQTQNNKDHHSRFICIGCFWKLNDYDAACEQARSIQAHLIKLMSGTEEKYYVELESAVVEVLEVIEGADEEIELSSLEKESEGCEDIDVDKHFEVVVDVSGSSEVLTSSQQHGIVEETSTPIPLVYCNKCELFFESKHELNQHNRSIHSLCNYMCEICGQSYQSKSGLAMHKKSHQISTTTKTENAHKCPYCEKTFTQKGGLKRHIPMHTGEKPFQCDQCGKQFIHYSSFYMHKLAHQGVREKTCEICGFKLASSSHLNRHMRIHSGLKPYTCNKCGAKFAQRYNMMAHYQSHEGITRKNRYKCQDCGKTFVKKSMLDEHIVDNCKIERLDEEEAGEVEEVLG